jgi:hypothetical protein
MLDMGGRTSVKEALLLTMLDERTMLSNDTERRDPADDEDFPRIRRVRHPLEHDYTDERFQRCWSVSTAPQPFRDLTVHGCDPTHVALTPPSLTGHFFSWLEWPSPFAERFVVLELGDGWEMTIGFNDRYGGNGATGGYIPDNAMKWATRHGDIGHAFDDDGSIRLWPYTEAPDLFQRLCDCGGDEDWIALIPPSMPTNNDIPSWVGIGGFAICDVKIVELDRGWRLIVATHA